MLYPEILIAGCGNPLFGDDGFGPAVIEELQKSALPENVRAIDAGLSGPAYVFPLLDPAVTKKLIVVDIADFGAKPGAVTRLRIEDLPEGCSRDLHPGSVMESLRKIEGRIAIIIIGCQPKRVPYPEMEIGFSDEVRVAVSRTVRMLLDSVWQEYGAKSLCSREKPQPALEQPYAQYRNYRVKTE